MKLSKNYRNIPTLEYMKYTRLHLLLHFIDKTSFKNDQPRYMIGHFSRIASCKLFFPFLPPALLNYAQSSRFVEMCISRINNIEFLIGLLFYPTVSLTTCTINLYTYILRHVLPCECLNPTRAFPNHGGRFYDI